MQSQIRIRNIELLSRDVSKQQEKEDTANDDEKEHNKTCSNEPFDNCLFSTLIKDMKARTEDNCTAPFITGILSYSIVQSDSYV